MKTKTLITIVLVLFILLFVVSMTFTGGHHVNTVQENIQLTEENTQLTNENQKI